MEALFLNLVDMSIAASWLVLAILAVRFLFRRIPKWISCLLWALVALRLLCPFSIESTFSLVPDTEFQASTISEVQSRGEIIDSSGNVVLEKGPVPQGKGQILDSGGNVVLERPMDSTPGSGPERTWVPILSRIWIVGFGMMLVYVLISYLLLKQKVATSIPIGNGIKRSEFVDTPFVLGLIRPVIYLPARMDAEYVPYVIAHERAHIRRHDHWWKPLGYLLLSIYWFNPVLWIAYILLCRDIEAACDEKVIRDMPIDGRRAYSTALLNCSVQRSRIAACPLAFGEVGVKERIKGVMNYKKPAFWVVVTALIMGCVIAVCFLTSPKREIEFKAAEITPQGLLLECKPKSAVSDLEIQNCQLEYGDGEGKTVEMLGQPKGETGISLTAVEKGWQVDWSENFGILLPGNYRMVLTYTDKETGENQEDTLEFTVETSGVYMWRNTDDESVEMPRENETSIRVPGKAEIFLEYGTGREWELRNARTGETLFSGDVRSVAFADLNGDGICEVYAAVNDGENRWVQCYDLAAGQKLTLPEDDAFFNTLVVQKDHLFLVKRTLPENASYGVASCWQLSLTSNGIEALPLEQAYLPLTRQITGIETCGRRLTTLNAQQIPVMKSLLEDLKGHVIQASPEEFAQAQANYMNSIPIKVSYALGYRVVNVMQDCSMIWEDGSGEGYIPSDPEPLRSFLAQLTDCVLDRETSGTPFASEDEPWKWTSQITPLAIRSAKAYAILEYEQTETGTHSSSTNGAISQETLRNLLTILNGIPKEAITPGANVQGCNFRDIAQDFQGTGCSIKLLDGTNDLAVAIRWTGEKAEMLLTSQTQQYDDRFAEYLQNARLWVIQDEKLENFLQSFWEEPPVIFYTVGGEYNWQTPVDFQYGDFSLKLNLIDSWIYEQVPYTAEGHTGIRCRPRDVDSGWIYFSYWPTGFSPEEEPDRLIIEGSSQLGPFYTSYPSSAGTPNNFSTRGVIWSYQRTPLQQGDYAVINEGADSWFLTYQDQINDTMLLAEIQDS